MLVAFQRTGSSGLIVLINTVQIVRILPNSADTQVTIFTTNGNETVLGSLAATRDRIDRHADQIYFTV